MSVPHGLPTVAIDAHIHLYDPTRPEGVPWPSPTDEQLYRPHLPDDYRAASAGLGIKGTIVVEASSWRADNEWLLDLADVDPLIVAVVGSLTPGGPDFRSDLEYFCQHPRFVGIRLGTPWTNILAENIDNAQFLDDLRALDAADRSLDLVGMGGSGPAMLANVVALTERVPELRIIIQHLPYALPTDLAVLRDYRANLERLHERPNVFAKICNLGTANVDALDEIFATFGSQRLMYGSNWPVATRSVPFITPLQLLTDYARKVGPGTIDNLLRRSAAAAYHLWLPG